MEGVRPALQRDVPCSQTSLTSAALTAHYVSKQQQDNSNRNCRHVNGTIGVEACDVLQQRRLPKAAASQSLEVLKGFMYAAGSVSGFVSLPPFSSQLVSSESTTLMSMDQLGHTHLALHIQM